MLGNTPRKPKLEICKQLTDMSPVVPITTGHMCTIYVAVSSLYKTVNKLKTSKTSDCLIRTQTISPLCQTTN